MLDLDVDTALTVFKDEPTIVHTLQTLHDMGLGYLHLGESTPTLSGGEAQRLKLVAHMGRSQKDTLFVFDEPSVGLHPLDVQTLVAVFQRLLQTGATVIAIEHDLDVIANADYVLDLGPKGGAEGGRHSSRHAASHCQTRSWRNGKIFGGASCCFSCGLRAPVKSCPSKIKRLRSQKILRSPFLMLMLSLLQPNVN